MFQPACPEPNFGSPGRIVVLSVHCVCPYIQPNVIFDASFISKFKINQGGMQIMKNSINTDEILEQNLFSFHLKLDEKKKSDSSTN